MDFSPYQRRTYRERSSKNTSFFLFFLSAVVGFLIFWGIKSFFFAPAGTLSPLVYEQNTSRGEVKISDSTSWEILGDGLIVTEGDEMRIKKGNSGVLKFKNGSSLQLGLGAQVKVIAVKGSVDAEKNDEALVPDVGSLFGEVSLAKGPIVLRLTDDFDEEKGFKFWIADDKYLEAKKGVLFFDKKGLSVIDGENFVVRQVDESGKIRAQKSIGIAQHLDAESFAVQGVPERIKASPLLIGVFSEEDNIHTSTEDDTQNEDIDTPKITSPENSDEMIEISKSLQIIEGTAPDNAEKIWVFFTDEEGNSDEYLLKNFSEGDKKWKYVASPQYDNLSKGKNTYKIFSETADGKRSSPSILILNYSPGNSGPQIFSNSKGKLLITSPANGNNTTQSSSVISLKGVAPSNARYITVVNKTLGTEYTLTKFSAGDSSWAYSTGKMDNKSYSYLVKAQDARKKTISSDTIVVTVKSAASTPVVSLLSPTSTATPVPTPEASPVVSPPAAAASTGEASR